MCIRDRPTDIAVLTDEKWLLFILEQLLSNAVKYTEEGTVAIFVDENRVLHIVDTGIGIAPEDLPRVFEKGFTGYNGRADKKSTGLEPVSYTHLDVYKRQASMRISRWTAAVFGLRRTGRRAPLRRRILAMCLSLIHIFQGYCDSLSSQHRQGV